MHGGENSLDRPLGMGAKVSERSNWRRNRLQSVVVSVLAVAVFAGSFMIALRDRPFRNASPVAISTPEITSRSQSDASDGADISPSEFARSSSSVIQVDPHARRDDGSSVIVIRDPSSLLHDPATAHLPDRDLLEESHHGDIPRRSADGRRPFDAYARPWSGAGGARVAIVIGGIGVSQAGTENAIGTLPPEITLAFASGGHSLDQWMQTARREGHEIVMQVPFEPFDYPAVDPGQNTLTVDANAQENRDRLHWALGRITNYTGITNYMGARFVNDEEALGAVVAELGRRGLMFFDDGSSARSRAGELARVHGVPFAASNMVIDAMRERGAILEKLDELERMARANGYAVATGSAFDVTVDAVTVWAREARRRGIELVPVSAIALDPERN